MSNKHKLNKCGVCPSCTGKNKSMTDEQVVKFHSFITARYNAKLASLSPEELDAHYKQKAEAANFRRNPPIKLATKPFRRF